MSVHKKSNNIKRVFLLAAAVMTMTAVMAQEQSTSTLSRRSAGERRQQKENAAATPQVTDRLQAHYNDAGTSLSDADRQWMRVIYRSLDLDKDANAPLYYPEEVVDGQENLFRIIMRLLANNQIAAYEYLDGREDFSDRYRIKVGDLLDRFHIINTPAKGSTERNPRYVIDESDVPTNEVLSYYVIERWEFDSRNNRMRTIVEAICPVLHRSGDFGGEAVRYPMFWIKYSDLRPWLTQQSIFTSDDNNLPTGTYDDYFTMTLYDGDIYKTRNLRNRSMMQMYPDPDDLKRAQDSIQAHLEGFEEKLWVPDREDVIAAREAKEAMAAGSAEGAAVTEGAATADAPKAAKRSTRRSSKGSDSAPKAKKMKQSKPKTTSGSSSAARSVRRRK